jgi:hypothetical protein
VPQETFSDERRFEFCKSSFLLFNVLEVALVSDQGIGEALCASPTAELSFRLPAIC